ncbi:protein EMSY-LIKE 3-like isoform X2 [Ananas comosus]|uniref:Protein EMSY-LIKE 3-like isoform X2 n=1 Tax=Ananas comosus TaxID=4615 RepID=A0A6P5GQS6_ANACO|nr:protein EMSY-LIKE 3-like isoform X2 [Ananas comosus]
MERFGPVDSSGTDDDLPPSHVNGGTKRARLTGNGRAVSGAIWDLRAPVNEMESEIHQLELKAYSSVLRAFKAQSDAISWEKESLITELRKELRVSDQEHREMLSKANADDLILRIRECGRANGLSGLHHGTQVIYDSEPSHVVSASFKRQKTSNSTSAETKGTRPKTSLQRTPMPFSQIRNRSSSGALAIAQPNEALNALIGRKVMTRWPEDDNFYEAVITDYNTCEGLHALVYDISTEKETWEWVDLKEIPPEDIRWEGERGLFRNQSNKDYVPSQNGTEKNGCDSIEVPYTESVIKEVERVFAKSHLDLYEIQKAKKLLKDHEQSLMEALARLAEKYDDYEDMVGEGQECSDDVQLIENGIACDQQ